ANYCSLNISASYFAYTLKPAPVYLPIYRQAFLQANVQTFRPAVGNWGNTGVNLPARTAPATTNDSGTYITNEAMPFTKSIANVGFDCHQFPTNYLTRAADKSTSIFACKPPFGDSNLARHEYTKFDIRNGSLAGTGVNAVYVNVYNGNYL